MSYMRYSSLLPIFAVFSVIVGVLFFQDSQKLPTLHISEAGFNDIVIRARGTNGDENIALYINGQPVQFWNLTENFQDYTYTPPYAIIVNELSIEFLNDRWEPSNSINYDAQIDYITVNGTRYDSEHASTSSTGSWDQEGWCASGNKSTEWLHCSGGFTYNILTGTVVGIGSPPAQELAYGNAVITTDDDYRYIESNSLPVHATGEFPTRGNPNAIIEQNRIYRAPLDPQKQSTSTTIRVAGVALNGIPLAPNTAETYDPNISWAIEAFDADGIGGLGIDWSNAHVQLIGLYHYHGVPEGMLSSALADQSGDLIHVAWASDGFPVYYSQSDAYASSWSKKSGLRPDGPGANAPHDGTYTQDFEYVSGSGDLDACNGTMVDGKYIYIITTTFPYIQRCVYGIPDPSFDSAIRGR